MLGVYSIRDKKAGYSPVFCMENDDYCKRQLPLLCNDMMTRYPEDFQLYRVGSFDSDAGEIVDNVGGFPIMVCELKALLDAISRRADENFFNKGDVDDGNES